MAEGKARRAEHAAQREEAGSFSAMQEKYGPVARGMWLHKHITPDKWCITKEDLLEFKHEVRKSWHQGAIPDSEEHPNPHHDDKAIGPTLYQVCDHFIIPRTQAAGGMSYALMKHPTGLECDVFVTHAWTEGVFEFVDKTLRAWPIGKRHLWCCLLALPQNLRIKDMLGLPLEETPFARALDKATHVIVVPNCNRSIYTRLWCVYEAYLAARWGKTLVLPTQSKWSRWLQKFFVMALVPLILGYASGYCAWGIYLAGRGHNHGTVEFDVNHGRICDFATRLMLVLCIAMLAVSTICRWRAHRKVSIVVHMLMMYIYPVIWVVWSAGGLAGGDIFKQLFMSGVGCARLTLVVLDTHRWLAEDEVQVQAHQLRDGFQSVEDADCFDRGDAERIRRAIEGEEEHVDEVIHVLMESGAYTEELCESRRLGMDIQNLGHTDLSTTSLAGANLWFITMVIVVERGFRKWSDEASPYFAALAAASSFASLAYLFVYAIRGRWCPVRSDQGQFVVRAWSWSAVCVMMITVTVLGVPHCVSKDHRVRSSFSINPFSDDHPPPPALVNAMLLASPLWALLAAVGATKGHSRMMHMQRDFVHSASCVDTEETEDLTSEMTSESCEDSEE